MLPNAVVPIIEDGNDLYEGEISEKALAINSITVLTTVKRFSMRC